jgi:hypothetical protein
MAMNWLLGGIASISVVVCLTAFVLFATSSIWALLILAVIIGICVYGSAARPHAEPGFGVTRPPEEHTSRGSGSSNGASS